MYRQAENRVKIEGILAETDLKYGSFVRNGETVETIGGSIKVQVNQNINGESSVIEVPVYLFSSKMTKKGTLNPAYESIEKVMKEFVSIAAAGGAEHADRVRITNASIRMNEFIGQDGRVVSQPRIQASFVSRAVGDFKPEASFALEIFVANMARAMDNEGVELDPAKLEVQAIVPQYTSETASALNVDVVPLTAVTPGVINAIESSWEIGQCYKCAGRLNFSSKTEEVVEELGFGDPVKKTRTINTHELIVTAGTEAPLEGDFAWSLDEIKAGMAARKNKLEEMKNGKNAGKKTPAPGKKTPADLGF